jgi:hypothetical protein
MVLSATGLREGSFTRLSVLKNGIMQDVLSLTASGVPDISLGSLVVGHTSGLQTQLNSKASTAALTSLVTEIDTLAEGVGALGGAVGVLGSTVVSLGAAVATKADAAVVQQGFTATNSNVGALGTLVNNGYTTLEAGLATKAAQIDLAGTVAILGFTQQDVAALTTTVATKADATVVQQGFTTVNNNASALATMVHTGYTTLEAGLATKAAQIDLEATNVAVSTLNDARVSMQVAIAYGAANLVYTQQAVADLTTEVSTKADVSALSAVSATLTGQLNTVSSLLGTRASTTALDGLATLVAAKQDAIGTSLTIGDLQISGTDVALLKHPAGIAFSTPEDVTFAVFSPAGATLKQLIIQEALVLPNDAIGIEKVSGLSAALAENPGANSLSISMVNGLQANLDQRLTTVALEERLLQKQNVLTDQLVLAETTLINDSSKVTLNHPNAFLLSLGGVPSFGLDSMGASFSDHLDCVSLSSGPSNLGNLTVNGRIEVIGTTSNIGEWGNAGSYTRCTNGHHYDTYARSNNVGRGMNLQNYTNAYLRVGSATGSLGVNCNPAAGWQFDVVGTGRFTGAVSALSYTSSSDERLKADVIPASIEECTRLVQTVRPQTYRRTDLDSTRRLGYVANHWDAALSPEHRNIMGPVGEESLLSLDYSRICCILHGALLGALARIEALESRLP